MILSQILYQKQNETKNVLILILGRKGNKVSAILDDAISRKDADQIMQHQKQLDRYMLQNKISWFKSNAPESYKKGYREFISSKMKIQKSYSLTSKKFINARS